MTDQPPHPPQPDKPRLTDADRVQAIFRLSPEALRIFDLLATGQKIPSAVPKPSLKLLSIKETAEKLNVARSTVERLLDDGALPYVTLRKNRRRIREMDIEEMINRSTQTHKQQ